MQLEFMQLSDDTNVYSIPFIADHPLFAYSVNKNAYSFDH